MAGKTTDALHSEMETAVREWAAKLPTSDIPFDVSIRLQQAAQQFLREIGKLLGTELAGVPARLPVKHVAPARARQPSPPAPADSVDDEAGDAAERDDTGRLELLLSVLKTFGGKEARVYEIEEKANAMFPGFGWDARKISNTLTRALEKKRNPPPIESRKDGKNRLYRWAAETKGDLFAEGKQSP